MKRSKFSLSHHKLLTGKMGLLIPLTWFEVLPGDTVQQSTSALIRCAPMVTPIMHPVSVRIHHFFVPNRIIWTNWVNFITGGPNGLDATAHPFIQFANNSIAVSSLADYLGLPTAAAGSTVAYSALPFRAYSAIWNEFYRDQDLQTLLTVSTGDGNDATTNIALQNVCWEKDYLTSCRPWEQKGPSISVPLAGNAPIRGLGVISTDTAATSQTYFDSDSTSSHTDPAWTSIQSVGYAMRAQSANTPSATNIPQVFADLSGATGADINVVRHAFAMQRFQEARARYGSRYVEYLRYLGVRSSDARLQRPEYLGGGRQTLQFSEILQTAPTTSGTAGGAGGVGQFGGHGISALRTNRYRRFFEEHGIVMSLMSVRPKTMYSQRVPRAFLRGLASLGGIVGTKEDYWQRELEHIGQQQICLAEMDISAGFNAGGFQDRYDEYRRSESSVAGLFRTTLDTWHLSREFASAPSLNATFVSCVPSQRIFADTVNDNLYVMANHSIQARRLLSQTGSSMTF